MIVEWTPTDIVPGRVVGKVGRSERWMICYAVGTTGNLYSLVSLSDGLICGRGETKIDLALHLSGCGELPAELLDSKWMQRGRNEENRPRALHAGQGRAV